MKLTVKEYMSSRNVSRRTIYNRIENGQLTTIKENNKLYIISENLDAKKQNESKKSDSVSISLEALDSIKDLVVNIKEKSNSFDYKLLRERLISLDAASINIFNKLDILSKYKIDENLETVVSLLNNNLDQINSLDKRISNIEKNIENLDAKADKIQENIIDLTEKLSIWLYEKVNDKNEHIEKIEKKKLINIFNKK
ncbi:MAG: hypothetical protein KBF12_09610 [Sebaldella sp.]|nr:hypothetical protein [Sebaldella sp.]